MSGLSGEQFALADAVAELRAVRRTPTDGALIVVSAADPLNLAGIVTAGERVPSISANRIVYRDGVPLAVLEAEAVRPLSDYDPNLAASIAESLTGRAVRPFTSAPAPSAVPHLPA